MNGQIVVILLLVFATLLCRAEQPPHIIVFTVDDMDYDSIHRLGNPMDNVTPNIDRLIDQGLLFEKAHVSASNCMPVRQSMMTGLHAHRNQSYGFIPVPRDVPSLSGILSENGYYTVTINKGRDYAAFHWDHFVGGFGGRGFGRDPQPIMAELEDAFSEAERRGQRLYIGLNTPDPHRPFPGSKQEQERLERTIREFPRAAGRAYFPDWKDVAAPEDVYVPPYLPDLPDIRKEWAQYYRAVHRADALLGEVMNFLEEKELASDTLLIFFSDHGASFPTSKNAQYTYSTRTPLIFHRPGHVDAGRDRAHWVNTIDLMPTLLDLVGAPIPADLDGRSLVPIIEGEEDPGRDHTFTTNNYIRPGAQVFPMRAIHIDDWSFIFNPWSDGTKRYERTEPLNGLTMAAIYRAAEHGEDTRELERRITLRRRYELFHTGTDPFCLRNLADDQAHSEQFEYMKRRMESAMRATDDPLLPYLLGKPGYPAEWDVAGD